MTQTMKAAVMKGIGQIEIEELPIPVPGEEERGGKDKSVGVCGSDVHYFVEGRIGDYVVKPPFILGHECAGEVVEIGKKVKNLKPEIGYYGTRYPAESASLPLGRYNLCPDVVFWATPRWTVLFVSM